MKSWSWVSNALAAGAVFLVAVGCSHSALETAETESKPPSALSRSTLIDVRELYQQGRFDLAEKAAGELLESDPNDRGAAYYMELIRQCRAEAARRRHGSTAWYPTYPPKPAP